MTHTLFRWMTVGLRTSFSVALLSSTLVQAQTTSVDINELRKELARAQIERTDAEPPSVVGFREVGGGASPSVEVKDAATRELLSAEQKLLEQLQATETDLEASDFSHSELDREIIAEAPPTIIADRAAVKPTRQNVQQLQNKIEATDAALSELGSDISKQMASLGREEETAESSTASIRQKSAENLSQRAEATTSTKASQRGKEAVAAKKAAVPNVAEEALAKMEGASRQITSLQREAAALRMQLSQAQQKNTLLSKQLAEARNRLLIAETEVERLSTIIERRTPVRTTSSTNQVPPPTVAARPAAAPRAAVVSQKDSDMPFVTVMVDKANLRIGPNTADSPVMTVSKGTRLTVETRQGPWFRVYAPNGNRLWVSADVVAFGKDATSAPSETVRIRALGSSAQGDEFKFK